MAQIRRNLRTIFAVVFALSVLAQQVRAFEPIVDTGVSPLSPDGKHVAVHLPGILNLEVDTRGPQKGAKIVESVLMGLVKVNIDRVRDASGDLKGPIKVSVAGVTVYDNKAPAV